MTDEEGETGNAGSAMDGATGELGGTIGGSSSPLP